MSRYKETYLVSYMIGEGLSAFVPSITSLLQGVGGNPTCVPVNASDPNGPKQQYTPPPYFSVSTFLVLIFVLQLLSLISFMLLKYLPVCKKQRNDYSIGLKNNNENEDRSSMVVPASPERRRNQTSDGDNEKGNTEPQEFDSGPSSLTTQVKVNFEFKNFGRSGD